MAANTSSLLLCDSTDYMDEINAFPQHMNIEKGGGYKWFSCYSLHFHFLMLQEITSYTFNSHSQLITYDQSKTSESISFPQITASKMPVFLNPPALDCCAEQQHFAWSPVFDLQSFLCRLTLSCSAEHHWEAPPC